MEDENDPGEQIKLTLIEISMVELLKKRGSNDSEDEEGEEQEDLEDRDHEDAGGGV